jgi:hypothetical protein
MSKICEKCRGRIRRPNPDSPHILRKDAATGYTCRFCSEDCARIWSDELQVLVSDGVAGGVPTTPGERGAA